MIVNGEHAESAHRLSSGRVRKEPVANRKDEDWTASRSLSWDGGGGKSMDRGTVIQNGPN